MTDDRLSQADLDRIIADPLRATPVDAERMANEIVFRRGVGDIFGSGPEPAVGAYEENAVHVISDPLDPNHLAAMRADLGDEGADLRFLVANLQRMEGVRSFGDRVYDVRDRELMGWDGPKVMIWSVGCDVVREMVEKYGVVGLDANEAKSDN